MQVEFMVVQTTGNTLLLHVPVRVFLEKACVKVRKVSKERSVLKQVGEHHH
jgi:hypothetical protein